jgi:predicted nucleic acid-binding protein
MIWKFPATGVKSGERISNDPARHQRPFRASEIQALFEGHLVDRQAAETLHIRTTSHAELRFDVTRMPEGKRKNDLAPRVEQALHLFKGRTLTFDVEAAEHLGSDPYPHRNIGRKTPAPDAYIAAIAMAHGFIVATRNLDHLHDTGRENNLVLNATRPQFALISAGSPGAVKWDSRLFRSAKITR